MGSLQDLQRLVSSKEDVIKRLETELKSREDLIEELRSQLDKFQSVLPKSLLNPLSDGQVPRKQRAQGISAAPQGTANVKLQNFRKYSKPEG